MNEIRDSILKQMLELGLSIYQVAKLVKNKIPQRTVYAFLTGEKDAGTETASVIMKALGLTVKPKSNKIILPKGVKVKEQKPMSFSARVKQEWEKAGKPKWNKREVLAISLLVDFELKAEGANPAPTFRNHVESNNYSKAYGWSQGIKCLR